MGIPVLDHSPKLLDNSSAEKTLGVGAKSESGVRWRLQLAQCLTHKQCSFPQNNVSGLRTVRVRGVKKKKKTKAKQTKKQEIKRPERWVTDSVRYSKSDGSGPANTIPLISELMRKPQGMAERFEPKEQDRG